VRTSTPPVTRKSGQTYSCRYSFPSGSLTLTVKEFTDETATDTYFAKQHQSVGSAGGAVVRQDFDVVTVDVARLPKSFGHPERPRTQVAQAVANTVLAAWQQGRG
jgi:hypothetical protein